jgi:hypothetical protein
MNKKYAVAVLLVFITILLVCAYLLGRGVLQMPFFAVLEKKTTDLVVAPPTVPALPLYINNVYGFTVKLPTSWEGYAVTSVQKDTIHGSYFEVNLIHPQSAIENPRMNVPILVVPSKTWDIWYPPQDPESGQHPFAAPVPATERGRNANYVFATAPRYNFSYLPGWEEVEKIIQTLETR